jgi:hypothetical protein
MRLLSALAAVTLLGACARPTRSPSTVAPAETRVQATESAGRREIVSVIRDSAAIRQICVAPASVLAGRKPCEVDRRRNPYLRVF